MNYLFSGLMIAASVLASPRLGDYILTFNSTLGVQEMTAPIWCVLLATEFGHG